MFEEELLDYPEISYEDIDSEIALRKLEGLRVRREIVTKKHWRETGHTMIYGVEPPPDVNEVFAGEPRPSFTNIEALIDWAKEQGDEIFDLIDWFFDAPTERINAAIDTLEHMGFITPKNAELARKPLGGTFVGLVRRQFAKYKELDWDYLIELAQNELQGEVPRPDVTIRTTLHNLEVAGEIEYIGEGTYRWLGQKRP